MARLVLKYRALLIIVLCFTLMTGCSAKPLQTGLLPAGTSITPLSGLRGEGPVAWHPSGSILATGTNGLHLLDLTTGISTRLDSTDPVTIVWSPDGSRLASAQQQKEETRLDLWNVSGELINSTILTGSPDQLLWSTESGLLLITSRLKVYSFGGDLTMQIHSWDSQSSPITTTLHSATLKPSTAKYWQKGMLSGSKVVLSPAGDELLYLRLHDPPAFNGSYRLALRHIASGAEKQIASLPLTTGAVQFINDEAVLVDDNNTVSTELFLWSKEHGNTWPYAGGPLAISPGGRYWLIGGHLLNDGVEVVSIQNLEQAIFSPDGSRLLLQSDGRWHILDGLIDTTKPSTNADDLAKLRQLRNWRSRGLITPAEFRQQKQRITQP